MPLTTKQALAGLAKRKQSLTKKATDLTNLERNYTQLEANYKELQEVHHNFTEHADKLSHELTQIQEDKSSIQSEWNQIQNQLNRAENVLKNYKPETIVVGDKELTAFIQGIYSQYLGDYSNINQLEKATQEIKTKVNQIESTKTGDKHSDYPHLLPYLQGLETIMRLILRPWKFTLQEYSFLVNMFN